MEVKTSFQIFITAVLLIAGSGFLLQVLVPATVHNFSTPALVLLLPLFLLAAIVIYCAPSKLMAFGLGIFVGGAATNIVIANISDVADYIHVLGTVDHYCNLPDLAIVAGGLLAVVAVVKEILNPGLWLTN